MSGRVTGSGFCFPLLFFTMYPPQCGLSVSESGSGAGNGDPDCVGSKLLVLPGLDPRIIIFTN